MGCDIHVVIEENLDGRWIGLTASDRQRDRPKYAERDYDFFAEIANVHGNGRYYPKNLPRDVSELAWHMYMQSPTDHHSASHMDIESFCAAHHRLNPNQSRAEHVVYDLTGLCMDEGEEYRVVFWFDN